MARGTAGGQAEVAQIARVAGGLQALEALDLLHLIGVDVDGADLFVIVHERAQADAQRAGDLDEGRKRRGQLPALESFDDGNVAAAAIGQILRAQMMRLAQSGDLLAELVRFFHFSRSLGSQGNDRANHARRAG